MHKESITLIIIAQIPIAFFLINHIEQPYAQSILGFSNSILLAFVHVFALLVISIVEKIGLSNKPKYLKVRAP